VNTLTLRIYYEDTDFSGFVYHARYLHFFERGRTEALRVLGVDHRALFEAEGGPFFFVVRHMTIDFKSPARMDDVVTVETRVSEVGAASLVMLQKLLRGETVLCTARVEIAHLAGGKPRRFPADLRSRLDLLANP
jgi:acyl-CoA thioester hydrolase